MLVCDIVKVVSDKSELRENYFFILFGFHQPISLFNSKG